MCDAVTTFTVLLQALQTWQHGHSHHNQALQTIFSLKAARLFYLPAARFYHLIYLPHQRLLSPSRISQGLLWQLFNRLSASLVKLNVPRVVFHCPLHRPWSFHSQALHCPFQCRQIGKTDQKCHFNFELLESVVNVLISDLHHLQLVHLFQIGMFIMNLQSLQQWFM